MTGIGSVRARAFSDGYDRLISADEPLAGLQHRCGGQIPGTIAIPALLEIVSKARRYALRLARVITTSDGVEAISAWVEVAPRTDGDGCEIVLRNWQSVPMPMEDANLLRQRVSEIDRELSELFARLDGRQRLLTVDTDAADLMDALAVMREGAGRPWTDFVTVENLGGPQPVHWRLLDGAFVIVPGSERRWRAHLFPQALPGEVPAGFELCLTSEDPPPGVSAAKPREGVFPHGNASLIGREIAPVLRQPIARIIANAETIHARLAGPLADEYASYAADISGAGRHLLGLLDDLADLEVVEAEDFGTSPDAIDLADVARQAAGILTVRALEKGISICAPDVSERCPAVAEFRRVLQVLLNLLSNAIRYSPQGSTIGITLAGESGRASVTVADEGPGLDVSQQERVFAKFERLGRSGDGGSGLGLYISRRLARAMGGELSVESAPGEGARFMLEVPGGGCLSG